MSVLQSMEQHAYQRLEARSFNFAVGAKASYKKITGHGAYESDEERIQGEIFYDNAIHTNVYFLGG